jgi:cellobiose phosphorylase
LPKDWPGYRLIYRYGQTCYNIQVDNQAAVNRGVQQVWLNGEIVPDGRISLRQDGRVYQVKVVLGEF